MKPTNRKKPARPQIRRERRESTINAMVRRKKLEKTKWGVGRRKGEREEKVSTQRHKPALPAPPSMGKGKKKEGRERNVGGSGRGRNNKRTRKRKYIRIIQSGKKSRWFLFLPTTKCTETIGHKRVKLPNPSHVYDAQTPGRGGASQHAQAWWTCAGSEGMLRSGPEMHLSWDSPGTLPCPAELPTLSCPP